MKKHDGETYDALQEAAKAQRAVACLASPQHQQPQPWQQQQQQRHQQQQWQLQRIRAQDATIA
eukprot:15185742-Alexandrium_andersonii.AAC.1